jgi:hypothetical protein
MIFISTRFYFPPLRNRICMKCLLSTYVAQCFTFMTEQQVNCEDKGTNICMISVRLAGLPIYKLRQVRGFV